MGTTNLSELCHCGQCSVLDVAQLSRRRLVRRPLRNGGSPAGGAAFYPRPGIVPSAGSVSNVLQCPTPVQRIAVPGGLLCRQRQFFNPLFQEFIFCFEFLDPFLEFGDPISPSGEQKQG